ncbi:hypothetical protein KIN20_007312 [Parelaphostrongylus tenuis]|uniref:Uncharacterized protein n=1 Tax=Parelaphostrongylus tenuis TaxID=148309 RepID=A0AAD5QLX9_PARTN|nr:hypothetical protein KIN20_007312 [Parelaphostrongylus tenuis]
MALSSEASDLIVAIAVNMVKRIGSSVTFRFDEFDYKYTTKKMPDRRLMMVPEIRQIQLRRRHGHLMLPASACQ